MSSDSAPKRTSPADLKRRGFRSFEIAALSGLYSGFSPVASGTVASAMAVMLWLPLTFVDDIASKPMLLAAALLAAALLAIAAGVPLAKKVEEKVGPDPSVFTLDEFAGQWIALASPAVVEPLWGLVAFVFFRIFDIAKTWPVGWYDRRGGAIGILGDDVVAGLYANICSHVLWFALSVMGLLVSFVE